MNHLKTWNHAWQQISQLVFDFSKIRAILKRDGLILYQLNITQNKQNWKTTGRIWWTSIIQINSSNHTTIFCKTCLKISKTNKDLTTNNAYVLCVFWTHTKTRRYGHYLTFLLPFPDPSGQSFTLQKSIPGAFCTF